MQDVLEAKRSPEIKIRDHNNGNGIKKRSWQTTTTPLHSLSFGNPSTTCVRLPSSFFFLLLPVGIFVVPRPGCHSNNRVGLLVIVCY